MTKALRLSSVLSSASRTIGLAGGACAIAAVSVLGGASASEPMDPFASSAFGSSAFGSAEAFGAPAATAFAPTSTLPMRTALTGAHSRLPRLEKPLSAKERLIALAGKARSQQAEDIAFASKARRIADESLDDERGMANPVSDEMLQSVISAQGTVENNNITIGGDFTPSNVIQDDAFQGAEGAVTIIQNAASGVVIETQMNVTINFNNTPL